MGLGAGGDADETENKGDEGDADTGQLSFEYTAMKSKSIKS